MKLSAKEKEQVAHVTAILEGDDDKRFAMMLKTGLVTGTFFLKEEHAIKRNVHYKDCVIYHSDGFMRTNNFKQTYENYRFYRGSRDRYWDGADWVPPVRLNITR